MSEENPERSSRLAGHSNVLRIGPITELIPQQSQPMLPMRIERAERLARHSIREFAALIEPAVNNVPRDSADRVIKQAITELARKLATMSRHPSAALTVVESD